MKGGRDSMKAQREGRRMSPMRPGLMRVGQRHVCQSHGTLLCKNSVSLTGRQKVDHDATWLQKALITDHTHTNLVSESSMLVLLPADVLDSTLTSLVWSRGYPSRSLGLRKLVPSTWELGVAMASVETALAPNLKPF